MATNPTYNTGIPGFDILSNAASSNIRDLLSGTESPAITQNMNAYWGAQAGVPGSEFLRNRAMDLYGQRGQARKEQGLTDLLNMLQGYSGTVVARPGELLGAQTARYATDVGAQTAANQLAQQASQFGQTFPESQRQFNLNYNLGLGGLANQQQQTANQRLATYMNFLQ